MIIELKKEDLIIDLKLVAFCAIKRVTGPYSQEDITGTPWRTCEYCTKDWQSVNLFYIPGESVSIDFPDEFRFQISFKHELSCRFSFTVGSEWGLGIIDNLSAYPSIKVKLDEFQKRIYKSVVR